MSQDLLVHINSGINTNNSTNTDAITISSSNSNSNSISSSNSTGPSMQDLMNLLTEQSKVISSLQKTIEGLNETIKNLNDKIVSMNSEVVDKEVSKEVNKAMNNSGSIAINVTTSSKFDQISTVHENVKPQECVKNVEKELYPSSYG